LVKKRTEHIIHPDEIEIGPFQLQLMFGEAWQGDIDLFLSSIFCDCEVSNKRLINYKSYLNSLNDITLRGICSGCRSIAIRYIETGERKEIEEIANKIRKLNKN